MSRLFMSLVLVPVALFPVRSIAQDLTPGVSDFKVGGAAFQDDFLDRLNPQNFPAELLGNRNRLQSLGFSDFVIAQEDLGSSTRDDVNSASRISWTFADFSCAGCIEQVVSPKKARDQFGGVSGAASRWRARSLEADQAAIDAEKVTCDAAVQVLFDTVCDGNRQCVIEDAYGDLCVQDHTNSPETLKSCLTAEATYVDACFGDGAFLAGADHLSFNGILSADTGEAVCSASVATMPENYVASGQDAPVQLAFTAEHCIDGDNQAVGFRAPRSMDLVAAPARRPDHGSELDQLDARMFPIAFQARFETIQAADPVLFEPTAFCGLNAISMHRRAMAEMNNLRNFLHGGKCDTSNLCTIVSKVGTELRHTCQSTRGGSGGALVQKQEDQFVLVGINEGSDATGVVASNLGISFR